MMLQLFTPAAYWGLAAAIPAVLAEYLYKIWPANTPWWHGLPLWVPIQLCIGYCVYRLVSDQSTGTLLDAFVIWAFATTLMRVVITVFILGENVKGGTWFALCLLIMAKTAQTFWGR